ncbi:large subunit terminase [Caudoviricetes sp.]|nr:large subunit terminase [Caudoviricetes sp.]
MIDFLSLNPIQSLVFSHFLRVRRLCLMLPRQVGKTELGVRMSLSLLGETGTRQALFLAKSRPALKKMSNEKFHRLFDKKVFDVNTEKIVNKSNPATAMFLESVDKDPDRIRGGTYHYIHWSEVAFSRFEHQVTVLDVMDKILKPTLKVHNGYCFLESTANGQNGWYDLWNSAHEYGLKTLKISYSDMLYLGLISREDYDEVQKTTHPLVFKQEYECEFVNFLGLVYDEFQDYHVQNFEVPYGLDLVCCAIDWGFQDANCLLAGYRMADKFYIFDEIYEQRQLIEQFADAFKAKIKLWQCKRIAAVADHEPDRIAELQRRGIPCGNANKADVLGNRVQVKELFWGNKIVIHPRCKALIRDLKSATWAERTGSVNSKEEIDYKLCTWGHYDAEAALRYLVRELLEASTTSEEVRLVSNTDILKRGNYGRN